MNILTRFTLRTICAFLLPIAAFATPQGQVDPRSTQVATPLFDHDSNAVFDNINDWLAQIRTLWPDILVTRKIENTDGTYFAAVSKIGPHNIGVFVYDTRTHSITRIGWTLLDSNGKSIPFIGAGVLTKSYEIFDANSNGTMTIAYGSGASIDPAYHDPITLIINTSRTGHPIQTALKFNFK